MNIVFLDADTIGQDMDLTAFEKLGNVTVYGFSSQEEMIAWAGIETRNRLMGIIWHQIADFFAPAQN